MLETAVAARPDWAQGLADLAQLQLMMGDEAAALASYERCVARDPSLPAAWLNLGTLMLRADRVAEAGPCFEKAIAVDPGLADAHAGLGIAHQRQHRYTDAADALRRAAELAPQDPEIRSNLGGVLHELGDHEAALARFEEAIALAPERGALHAHVGVIRHEVEGAAAALPHYDAALRLSPGHTHTLAAKHSALASLGRRAEAAQIFDYDALIVPTQLTAAAGYPDMPAFNAALADHAVRHPTLMAEPVGKTTRGGSQTGHLLGAAAGPVATLEGLIRTAIDAYFADAARVTHPYCPRRPIPGRLFAWATVLDRGGFQDAHIHPGGFLSGVYYVQVPEESEAGAIEFGRPAPPFDLADPDTLLLRPKPGLLVLFPSFIWHRTIPFEGSAQRISIAFDLM